MTAVSLSIMIWRTIIRATERRHRAVAGVKIRANGHVRGQPQKKERKRLLRHRNRKHHRRFWKPMLSPLPIIRNPLPKSSVPGNVCIIRCMIAAWKMRIRLSQGPARIARTVAVGNVRNMETVDWSATLQSGESIRQKMRKQKKSWIRNRLSMTDIPWRT